MIFWHLADGDIRVWHYNEGFYMERKQDLIISWRYASLAMNRGPIKRGFTVYIPVYRYIYIKSYFFLNWPGEMLHKLTNVLKEYWYCIRPDEIQKCKFQNSLDDLWDTLFISNIASCNRLDRIKHRWRLNMWLKCLNDDDDFLINY